jgi:RNA polymerase sigma factor (sigma-70 family)
VEAHAIHALAAPGRLSTAGPLLRVRSDDQLVALFRMGYDEAFRVIHDRYRQRLFGYARQMLAGSRSDAEDALQDVFLRAYSALRDDDRPVTLRAWLYRVAHNRCVDHLRRPVPPPPEVLALTRAVLHDPLEEVERREDLRRLVQDVQRLPSQQRSALLMRELEGLSYAELADALRTTIPAVKSLLVRARMGLVESCEARDVGCAEIRSELAVAHDRGVRASGRSRLHLRDCRPCRQYRATLDGAERRLGALSPGHGPLATLAKLVGLGGAGSGAAAGATAGAGAGGSAVVAGGAATAAATKVVAVVCCAAVVTGGAAKVEHRIVHRDRAHAAPAAYAARPAPATSAVRLTAAPARAASAVSGGVRHRARPVEHKRDRSAHRRTPAQVREGASSARARAPAPAKTADPGATPGAASAPSSDPAVTGGTAAPDEGSLPDPNATGLSELPAPAAAPPASVLAAAEPAASAARDSAAAGAGASGDDAARASAAAGAPEGSQASPPTP